MNRPNTTASLHSRNRPARAVWALAALAIVTIAVAVAVLLVGLRSRELEHARRETLSLTRMLMEQTAQALDGVDLALQDIRDRLEGESGNAALDGHAAQQLLNAHIPGMPQVAAFFVVDSAGQVLNASARTMFPAPSPDAVQSLKRQLPENDDGLRISPPVPADAHGTWTLLLARRIGDKAGRSRGMVVAALDLSHFERLYEFMQLDFVRPIALYQENGQLVASLPHHAPSAARLAMQTASVGQESPDAIELLADPDSTGGHTQYSLGHVAGFPFLVSVTNDRDEALASWRETAVPIALGGGVVCVFLGVIATLLVVRLRREESLLRALREADDRYLRTIDSVMDAIIAADETQRITMYNRAAERMFGRPKDEVIGQALDSLIPQHLQAAHQAHVEGFHSSGVDSRAMAPQLAITGLRADGSEFPIESTISQTQIGGKPQFTAVLRDITERRRAEAELREMNDELRRLSISLQSVREEERTRISRELHDELGQQLTALKLDLSWLSTRLKENRPADPSTVDAMRQLLDSTIAAVRRISTELRPRILDDLGFGEAVSWQTMEFAKRSGIEVSLDLRAAEHVRDDSLATALFRVVQESLTNVARHAEARHVRIALVEEGAMLILRVIDDGKGFVPVERHGGIGLVSMRERATALGGWFEITGSPGAGTRIEVKIPFRQETAEAART